uniref:Uncharacterized protein n=1 Tax=Rhizophora mucronata TaxID=61149 RepID=A0A2P2P6V2_RHIMU
MMMMMIEAYEFEKINRNPECRTNAKL